MVMYKVYVLKNAESKICYVGLTRQALYKRFYQHKSLRNLDSSYSIHLEQDNLTLEQAIEIEETLIIKYNTRESGFNKSPKSVNGYSNYHSEEQKSAWSNSRKGIKVSPEHAEKNRIARIGKKNSPEHKLAILAAKRKPVYCEQNGTVYSSQRMACKLTGILPSQMCKAVKTGKAVKGFTFVLMK